MLEIIQKIIVRVYVLGLLWALFEGFYYYDALSERFNFHSRWDILVYAAKWPERLADWIYLVVMGKILF